MKTCTWIGQGECCAKATVPFRSYCEDHVWKIYQEGTRLARRRKDKRTAATVQFWESLMNEAVEELINEGEL